MANSIFWHDYETTGTDPARDRAIQFAGIRTDEDLNVVGEPLNLLCYPGDDVIPVPEAIAVTGIRMSQLEQEGLRETEFIGRILDELGEPGTCGCGYNSIRFDDEFTRHLLYRNFLDPYAREWQGGNTRWDVIDLFRMCQALRPDGFEWPRGEAGEPVFRLEALAGANGVDHEDAHDALSDVMATIGVVRKLKAAQPRLYRYLYGLRQKRAVIDQLYPLGKFKVVHVSAMYGSARQFTAVVLPLCSHPTNQNGIICFDLSEDPSELISLGPDALHRRIFTRSAELEEGETRIPLKTIHVNRSPAVAPLATLTAADAERLGISLADCERHEQALRGTSGIVEKIQEAFGATRWPESDDPDLMLYGGDFFSDNDRMQMRELRTLAPESLYALGDGFDDPRVKEMVFRYRGRNYPETFNADERARWEDYRTRVSDDGERVRSVLRRIDAMKEEGAVDPCLTDLADWLHRRWSRFLA